MIRKIKTWIKDARLSKKMLLAYSFFAGIACVISMVALQITLNIYDGELYERSLQELDFFTQQVNASLDEIEQFGSSFAMNREVQEQLARMKELESVSGEYSLELYRLREMMMDELYQHPAVKNIIYINKDKAQTKAGADTGIIPMKTERKLLDEFERMRGGYVSLDPTEEYPYYLSGRNILEIKDASLRNLGALILTSDISGIIEEKNASLETAHSDLLVYSEEGVIYQDERKIKIGLPKLTGTKGYRIIRNAGEKYFMCYLKSSSTGWVYVNVFPYSEIFGQTMMVRYMVLAGFVFIFFGLLWVMRKMAFAVTRSLNQLTESMRIVETGDFKGAKSVLQIEKRNDETGLLAQEFQVMLDKIDILIHENYEKQLLLKDTNYKMLQAQINPHFLYNTLNALNWMVKGKRNDDAGKVIMELGKLLRASFAREPYTTVEDELETARGYITIQQYRYKSRAEFQIEEHGNLGDYMIPRMILQPLIENAIYYGIEDSLDKCIVIVRVYEEEKEISIEVTDSGQGMSAEELKQLRLGKIMPKGHGIGLPNIRERLKITYENSEFHIYSKLGEGTRVFIKIPKVKMEVPHV